MCRVVKLLACGAIAAFASFSRADDDWRVVLFTGKSLTVLGSEDPRNARGFGVELETGPESRLRWGSRPGSLVLSAYWSYSHSQGIRNDAANSYQAYGVLAAGRYRWRAGQVRLFGDVGLGIQMLSHQSRDLDSKINTTPVLDLGLEFDCGLLGVRLLHVSNAGVVGGNEGQNQLFLFVAASF